MKAIIFLIIMAVCSATSAQTRVPTYRCYQGDVHVNGLDDLRFVQSQVCIKGNVTINGLSMAGDEVFETFDTGNLRKITGVLVVRGCPRLKFFVSKLESVTYIDMSLNPMLAECRVEIVALRAGCAMWAADLVSQGCGLLSKKQAELVALREFCGVVR